MCDNAIDWATTTLKTLSNVSPIPPLTVAMDVVLSILQIVSKRMEGKEDVPQSLWNYIREFEDFLIKRVLEKSSVRDQLIQHEWKLKGARWHFQLSLSIETRYVLAPGGAPPHNPPRIVHQSVVANPIDPEVANLEGLQPESGSPSPTLMPTEEDEFLASMVRDTRADEEFGFRRYHQSDVIILKSNRKATGWFAGSSDADVCGQKMTIKRYEEDKDLKQWVRDIKMLRNFQFVIACCLIGSVANSWHVSHENLPQLLGYSHKGAPTPFILLAGIQNRALDEVMRSVLTTRCLADSASLILRTYRDIASAIAYAQRQLSLSQIDAQYFIEQATYSIDSKDTVVVGLPPPRVKGNTLYLRGLEGSVVRYVTQILEELVDVENSILQLQVGPHKMAMAFNRYEQLRDLLYFLLPRRREGLDLSPELEGLLDGVDEENPLTIPALQAVSMHQSRSIQWSYAESLVGPLKPGDYGYTAGDSRDLSNVVFLGNIQDGECVKEVEHVVCQANCTMFMLEHDPVICHRRSGLPTGTSLFPDDGECWEIPLLEGNADVRVCHKTGLASAKAAWEFLVVNGASLASTHGVEPQALILVTRYERNDDYDATGWLSSLGPRRAIEFSSTASDGPAFPVPERRAEAPLDTSIVNLITSFQPDFATYITDEPVNVSPEHSTGSSPSLLGPRCSGSSYEAIDHIRLDAENLE
ncbi:hypothetical protein BC826DRAFT_1107217 [Russula brevipes]|nr:hypothetical protein BC826DRAFT_1107217 [Russula brevipes]